MAVALIVWTGIDGPVIKSAGIATAAEWLGFFGALIGAFATIAAGFVAWTSVQHQIARADAIRNEEQAYACALCVEYVSHVKSRARPFADALGRALIGDDEGWDAVIVCTGIARQEGLAPVRFDVENSLKSVPLRMLRLTRACIEAERRFDAELERWPRKAREIVSVDREHIHRMRTAAQMAAIRAEAALSGSSELGFHSTASASPTRTERGASKS
ncbi:hypothetical protein [Ancylobacter sp.]|uniref:hypothetical protein n=1 Tax=Ancylobacter sp. TaxID=1872567 RepID=UPI003D101107